MEEKTKTTSKQRCHNLLHQIGMNLQKSMVRSSTMDWIGLSNIALVMILMGTLEMTP